MKKNGIMKMVIVRGSEEEGDGLKVETVVTLRLLASIKVLKQNLLKRLFITPWVLNSQSAQHCPFTRARAKRSLPPPCLSIVILVR